MSGIVIWGTERKRKEKAPTIEDKVTKLTENLKNSLTVISEIESEITNRSQIVDKLKDDVKHYENLKQLNEAQVEAIAQTIRGAVTSGSQKSIWLNALITFFVALIFFFLGFWLRGA